MPPGAVRCTAIGNSRNGRDTTGRTSYLKTELPRDSHRKIGAHHGAGLNDSNCLNNHRLSVGVDRPILRLPRPADWQEVKRRQTKCQSRYYVAGSSWRFPRKSLGKDKWTGASYMLGRRKQTGQTESENILSQDSLSGLNRLTRMFHQLAGASPRFSRNLREPDASALRLICARIRRISNGTSEKLIRTIRQIRGVFIRITTVHVDLACSRPSC